jgi:hypothetical protein
MMADPGVPESKERACICTLIVVMLKGLKEIAARQKDYLKDASICF